MDEVDSGMPWTLKGKSDESWMSKFQCANTDSVCSKPSHSKQPTYSSHEPKNSEASFSSILMSDHIGLKSYSNNASLLQWNDGLEVETGQDVPDACISNYQSFTADDCFMEPDLNLVNVIKNTKSFQGTNNYIWKKAQNDCLAADSQDYKSQAQAVCTEIKDVDNPKIVVIKLAELHLLLKAGLEKHLLIDCRSFLEYNTCHVQQAANICCSKIVKRRLQGGKVHIRDLLMQTCDIDVNEYMNVIVYDQCTENPNRLTEDNFLSVLLKKLSSSFETVALLKGGFLAFSSMYPSLCESKTSSYRCGALTSLSQPCLPVTNVGPTRILPFLYLGSLQDAMSPDIVQVNEITYVLNVSTTCIKPPYISDGHFLRIPVNDNYSAKLTPYFEQAFQFLDKVRESNGCCLVHCLAGISRSPTLAIAYIMKTLSMSSDDAYRYVKDKRPTISPNFNFLGQLLEYEKQIKFNNNNNSSSSSRIGSRIDSPEVKSYETKDNKLTNMISQRGLKFVSPCSSGPLFDDDIALGSWTQQSQSQGSLQTCAIDIGTSVKSEKVDEYTPSSDFDFKVHGKPLKSSLCLQSDMNHDIHSLPAPKLKLNTRLRPSVLNLGLEPTTARKVPDIGMAMSKSLTDIKEASETPSPVITTTQEHTVSTSYSCHRSQSADTLLSPFPCGESTIINHICQNEGRSSIELNSAQPPPVNALPSNFMVVTTLSKSTNETSSPVESKSFIHSLTSVTPSTSCPSLLLKAYEKRPQRSSLSLLLSPVIPSEKSSTLEASPSHSGASSTSAMTYAPSACKIEYKHVEQSLSDTTCITSSIPLSFPTYFPSIFSSASTLTTSHVVKLKSFNLQSSLPLNLSVQSPTTGLAKLNFGSSDNSENNVESLHINMEDFYPHSSFISYFRPNYKSLNESLEKLNSFPSTSLDKLNFTPCLSSSNENVHASSDLPRTSGVKRPLNNEIEHLKQSDVTSPLNSSSNSSVLLPTNSVEQKQVVHKREGRAKRTMVRPNSIAFSKYPTFDLGSDCRESPSSTSSSTSQDDSSGICAQNGKKSKPSEYMSDVGFRLGHYSEREVYRHITAAMMKSQSFEDSRKTRSLDDILSSEDDSSAPNCESSHFDLVLHNFTLTPDTFSSPPLFLEKHACGKNVAEHYNSNSSLSSSSSHASFHGSMELIQVS